MFRWMRLKSLPLSRPSVPTNAGLLGRTSGTPIRPIEPINADKNVNLQTSNTIGLIGSIGVDSFNRWTEKS